MISAKEISLIAAETIGWNKNTTYTVIKRLETKGFIQREDPGFICTPLVPQNQMQKLEALLEDEPLTEDEIYELRKLIDKR